MLRKTLVNAVHLYQSLRVYSPPTCRFYPSCSRYAIDALQRKNILNALWLIIKRLCSCHPWSTKNMVDILD